MAVQHLTLTKKIEIARGTMEFQFAKPADFSFRAGQYGDLTLIDPPETDEEGNTRAFSLVSAPCEDYLAVATRLRDTAFKRVLSNLPLGADVQFDGAHGDFTLHKTETTPAVFLIGGVGVTPVRSMIKQATHDKTAHHITLLHANRTLADAPFTADFEQLAAENPNFQFVPVITDDIPADWSGERGRIDADMLKKYVSDIAAPIYYLSGPPVMAQAMRHMLVDAGANEDNIRTEEFDGY